MTRVETSNVPMEAERSLAFSGAHTVATNVLQVAGSFAIAAFIARALGPEGKGEYDLYVTTANLMLAVLGLSLSSGIAYVTAKRAANISKVIRNVGLLGLLQGAVAVAVVLGMSGSVVGATMIPHGLASWAPMLFGLSVGALAVSSMLRAVLAGQRRFVAANYRDLAKQLIGVCCVVAAITLADYVHSSRLLAAVVANVLTVMLASFLYLAATRGHGTDEITGSGLRDCLRFAIPSYLGNMVQFLNYRVDVFFVSGIAGVGQLGIYQTAVLLAQSLGLIPGAAQAVLFPTVAIGESSGEETFLRIAQANRLLMAVSVAGSAVLILGAPWCVQVIFGPAFRGSVVALMWLLPGTVLFTTCTVLAAYFAGIGKPRINLVAALIGLAVTIPLDVTLIPKWGIRGAAIASSLSYAASAGATAVFFVRETGLPVARLFLIDRADLAVLGRAMSVAMSRALRRGRE